MGGDFGFGLLVRVRSKERRGEGENKRRNMRNKHKSIELFVNGKGIGEQRGRFERETRPGGEGGRGTMRVIACTDGDVCSFKKKYIYVVAGLTVASSELSAHAQYLDNNFDLCCHKRP
jgi:hypothetical protein